MLDRTWKQGDVVSIHMPLELRVEAAPGDARTMAFLRGPMVLAADLGSANDKWEGNDPAMVGDDLLAGFKPISPDEGTYSTHGILRPADMKFVPFYSQYQRRRAVYFSRFTEAEWKAEEAAFAAEQARTRDIAARYVDEMHLGESQPERDHHLTSENSYPVTYRGRQGRDARSGGYMEFTLKTKPGPLILQATYWGGERGQSFDILVEGDKVATQVLKNDRPGRFFDVEYPLAESLTRGKTSLKIRFLPHDRSTAGPVFGVLLFTARPAGSTPVA